MHTLCIQTGINGSEPREKMLYVVAEVLKTLIPLLHNKEAHQQSQMQSVHHETESGAACRQRTITISHLRNFKDC